MHDRGRGVDERRRRGCATAIGARVDNGDSMGERPLWRGRVRMDRGGWAGESQERKRGFGGGCTRKDGGRSDGRWQAIAGGARRKASGVVRVAI
jgi:hypothetical protein